MLAELHIKNFALIDSVDLEFFEGLNILTGETGAGKSILIDSVNFILGEKQSKEIIRTGQNSAYAEAVFFLNRNEEIEKLLVQTGIEVDENLIISREINTNGRSISRINGRTVTINTLKQLSAFLIDIHGQHEHQSLLDEGFHIKILDSFCGDNFKEIKNEYLSNYHKLRKIDKDLEDLQVDEQQKLRQIDLYRFQIQEIDDANIKFEEEIELRTKRDILLNSEKIFNALNASYKNLYENEEMMSAYDALGVSISLFDNIEKFDVKLKSYNIELNEIYYKLEALIENIRTYRENIEFNEEELSEIEFRLDLINKLKRKYGDSIEEILNYRNKISKDLENIEKSDQTIELLKEERINIFNKLTLLSGQITSIRRNTSEKLKMLIEEELKYLGMIKTIFKIDVQILENFNENGKNKVSFNISTNPGEPLKPLVKVASGGEMSRIMLAIKTVIADVDSIPTLIFDEIDTGISGRTAQAVAEKMSTISHKHQLFCVTHLPQIAAMADSHFKIQKIVSGDKTTTLVNKLAEIEQSEELARMLGGAIVTELTIEHAKEMIKLAKAIKKRNEY